MQRIQRLTSTSITAASATTREHAAGLRRALGVHAHAEHLYRDRLQHQARARVQLLTAR